MLNDTIEIKSGEVIDLGLEVDLVIDKNLNQSELIKEAIEKITLYFSVDKRKMGDPLFVGDLKREVGSIPGIVQVTDIRVYNKIGGEYSTAQVSQAYKDSVTKEILQSDFTIFMKSNQIFQIRFPNKDIKIRTKVYGSTTY